ncbi:hypothetical protein [Kineosporia babensis]|uniref:Uncharacterized protein n=1 Tax=Kineosporia babensis TaxID=499548 RepID=A0A9X1NJ01_9ACTN|nr:hypothetical protein [Kineosporia babensis]MCD5314970.1 hypothetical protein [Kineosporia babensis]
MRTSLTPGRRRPSPRRLWLLSLCAVALAITGTTVALQSASAKPPPRWGHRPITQPVATPSVTAEPSATEPSATEPSETEPAATSTSDAPDATDACGRKASASAQAKVTDVKLPSQVKGYGREGDTEVLPLAIASAPNGKSWLAWVAASGDKVYLGQLGCDDELVGEPTVFEGIDLQDVSADADGGVLLITKKGECGTGPLCGGTSSPCNTMHMIRFDTSGQQVWDRQVTNLDGSRKGYSDGARFVWWYQHHGRLAYDGENYAAYFGTAITVKNGNCVDIHQGDRMQVVDSQGALVKNQGFEVGCSHAWTSRILHDPQKQDWVMNCATDNQCRIAQPNPYRTVAASKCDGTLFGGDLVAAKNGYWSAWSQGNAVKLSRFTTGAAEATVDPGVATQHPHLVKYGADRMLISWGSGAQTKAKVLDRGTGATIGSELSIPATDHDFLAVKEYPDGSVAFPAPGTDSSSVKIARVLPMS